MPDTSPEKTPNFKGLVEAANSIILSMSKDGIVTYINPFGIEFFGFAPEEIMGRSPSETIAPSSFQGIVVPGPFVPLLKIPRPTPVTPMRI